MRKLLYLTFVILCISCGDSIKKDDKSVEDAARGKHIAERNLVDTIVLRRSNFTKEIVCNGRLRAICKSELRFPASGHIDVINTSNGKTIEKGKVIASLKSEEAQLRLEQSKEQFEKAKIDLSDVLIGFGLSTDISLAPKDKLDLAYIRSGFTNAKNNLEMAQITLNNCTLKAPFKGKIANLNAKVFEQASDVFCTLIDDAILEADFNVLESELQFVKQGQKVLITPFSDQEQIYTGVIKSVNPMVNEKGQINVRAEIANPQGKLIDGMNVKIVVQQNVPNQLVVPKSAVVMRDGFEVLFRVKDSNMALWTYVIVTASNTTSHVVIPNPNKSSDLNEGDIIITSGNLNLGNDSSVDVKQYSGNVK